MGKYCLKCLENAFSRLGEIQGLPRAEDALRGPVLLVAAKHLLPGGNERGGQHLPLIPLQGLPIEGELHQRPLPRRRLSQWQCLSFWQVCDYGTCV